MTFDGLTDLRTVDWFAYTNSLQYKLLLVNRRPSRPRDSATRAWTGSGLLQSDPRFDPRTPVIYEAGRPRPVIENVIARSPTMGADEVRLRGRQGKQVGKLRLGERAAPLPAIARP